jgi:hypothetical protein
LGSSLANGISSSGGNDAAGAGPGPDRQAAFRAVIAPLGATRRRHGTLAWGVFADAENPALVLESSLLAFKILVLQALYSLSDEKAEFQLRDRLSLMRFVGLDLHTPAAAVAWRRRIQHGRPRRPAENAEYRSSTSRPRLTRHARRLHRRRPVNQGRAQRGLRLLNMAQSWLRLAAASIAEAAVGSGGLSGLFLFQGDRYRRVRRKTHLLPFDARYQRQIYKMMVALITTWADFNGFFWKVRGLAAFWPGPRELLSG